MSAHCVDIDHADLQDAGVVEHDQLEDLLQGIVPQDLPVGFNVGVPFLSGDNTFSGNNTFSTPINGPLAVNGDLTIYGNRIENEVFNLNIEDVVITLGHGTGGELPASDRGLVMTADGPNPSLVWDHSEQEFRIGTYDVGTNVTEFPEPTSYVNLRAGDINAEDISATAINVNDISIYGSITTPELRAGSLKTSTGEDYLATHIVAGPGIEVVPHQETPGVLVINRTPRIKDIKQISVGFAPGTPIPVGAVENLQEIDNQLIDVFINGVMVIEGSELDYTITPGGIVFSFPLEVNDIITVTIG